MSDLNTKRAQRLKFLNHLYEVTNGNRHSYVNMFELGEKTGLSRADTQLVYQYLSGEGLVEAKALGGQIGITHFGVTQVEEAISHPSQETKYFPPVVNILNIHSVSNSQIQQGTTQSQQYQENNALDLEAIKSFVNELTSSIDDIGLSGKAKDQALADLDTIKTQVAAPNPKRGIIKECFLSLKSILEQVTASIIASSIGAKILVILSAL